MRKLLRKQKLSGLVIALIIIIVIAAVDRFGGVLPVDDDWRRYDGQRFEVVRVVDGDTLDVRVADGDKPTTRVRLWGVDTPELAKPAEYKPAEPFALEATAFSQSLAQGQFVTLELQQSRVRERYGRLLAYVVLPDGSVLNARLIEEGFSEHDGRWSHEEADAYDALEQRARAQKRGLWAN